MATPIDPNRVVKARQKLKEALAELDAAIAEAEWEQQETQHRPAKVWRGRKTKRRSRPDE